jgi:hypothetical protein
MNGAQQLCFCAPIPNSIDRHRPYAKIVAKGARGEDNTDRKASIEELRAFEPRSK